MGKKKKNKKNSSQKNGITKLVMQFLDDAPNKSFTYRQIAHKLNLQDEILKRQMVAAVQFLVKKNAVKQVRKGQYQAVPSFQKYEKGVIDITSRGNAYVSIEGRDEDVFISGRNTNTAFNKDIVNVYIFPQRKGSKVEGEVVSVVERFKTRFVGRVDLQDRFAFVVPSDPKLHKDFYVPLSDLNKANDGDKVLIEFTHWSDKTDSPSAKVIEVLGKPGEHQTEIHSILASYGLPHEFPKEVLEYADQIDTSITEDEIAKRRDMRSDLTFTIDPKDAKDFDDALSFTALENGDYEIGIHIADVSHYLKFDTVLNDEAFSRATSVYLVDRVVPMLPEILSNQACSLRPNEEKYTFSIVFIIDKNAQIKNQWIGRTVIDSNERFSYEEAQHIIETKSNEIPEHISIRSSSYSVDDTFVDAIITLDKLAKKLRKKRMSSGAISFDKIEVKFNLNQENQPTSVFFKESKDANKLIEEFMLLANKKVAEFIGKQDPPKTFVYRVHDEPNIDKLTALNQVVARYGHSLNLKDHLSLSKSLNQLLKDVVGKKEQNLVDTLAIRSMSKAEYSTENIGHYGLAFEYYTHFTSPIRRYPDVMVHRLLEFYLNGAKSRKQKVIEEACKHCSKMEAVATSAERESIKYMQIKYMESLDQDEFLGVISGVTEWGMYVEIIENKCEGMVRIKDIPGDLYTFDPLHYSMIGVNTKKTYQLGDEVTVSIKQTNLEKRQMDFNLIQASDR